LRSSSTSREGEAAVDERGADLYAVDPQNVARVPDCVLAYSDCRSKRLELGPQLPAEMHLQAVQMTDEFGAGASRTGCDVRIRGRHGMTCLRLAPVLAIPCIGPICISRLIDAWPIDSVSGIYPCPYSRNGSLLC